MKNVKSVAALKRFLRPGMTLTMTRHDWYPDGKLIDVPRVIQSCATRSICLATDSTERGSWMYWPPAAQVEIREDGFAVILDPVTKARMAYRVETRA